MRDVKNMCFCETNGIDFSMKTGDNVLRWNWMRSKRVRISIRFVWHGNDIGASRLSRSEFGARYAPGERWGLTLLRHQSQRGSSGRGCWSPCQGVSDGEELPNPDCYCLAAKGRPRRTRGLVFRVVFPGTGSLILFKALPARTQWPARYPFRVLPTRLL